jgi:tetratricopeptide (TPR) repeat protein
MKCPKCHVDNPETPAETDLIGRLRGVSDRILCIGGGQMKRLFAIICLIPLVLLANSCRGEKEKDLLTDDTNLAGHRVFSTHESDNALGYELAKKYEKLPSLIRDKKFEEALVYADDLKKEYEKLFSKEMKQYAFQTEDDYREFAKCHDGPIQWVDWSYKDCMLMQAFIEVERGNYPNALDILEKLELFAPISADILGEKGFVLLKMKDPLEALNTFDKMLAMSLKYSSQKVNHAWSLRGRGSALIDLGRLDEAEESFGRSLIIEPDNDVALNELKYIESIKK